MSQPTDTEWNALARYRRHVAAPNDDVYPGTLFQRMRQAAADRDVVAALALRLHPADARDSPDAAWAEAAGFAWVADGSCLVRKTGPFEVVLAGDLYEGAKPVRLSLCYTSGNHSLCYQLADDPTKAEVRRLMDALEGK